MPTAKEIWEAGKKALGMAQEGQAGPISATVAPLPGSDAKPPLGAPVILVPEDAPEVFDPADFDFEPRAYRIHFKNGHSGEYDGTALSHCFPFDPAQVQSIEPVGPGASEANAN